MYRCIAHIIGDWLKELKNKTKHSTYLYTLQFIDIDSLLSRSLGTCVYQAFSKLGVPGPAAVASHGNLLKRQTFGFYPRNCVLISPPQDSGLHYVWEALLEVPEESPWIWNLIVQEASHEASLSLGPMLVIGICLGVLIHKMCWNFCFANMYYTPLA